MRKSLEQAIIIPISLAGTAFFAANAVEAETLRMAAMYGGAAVGCLVVANKHLGPRRLASRKAWSTMGREVVTVGDVQTWVMRWKEDKPATEREFFFNGNGLPYALPESRLMKFCRDGFRRQALAEHKTLVRDGDNFRRVKSKDILSESHFVNEARFDRNDYLACLHVLACTYLMTGRRAGTSGRLIDTPGRTVDLAKSEWLRLTTPRARDGLFSLPRLFATS